MGAEKNGLLGDDRNNVTIRERLFKYLAYWPLFVICLGICLGLGMLYLRHTAPKYIATTSILVKGSENGASTSNDIIDEALNGKRQVNLNNEILLMGSTELMLRTVAKNGFNISYFIKGRLVNTNIHNNAPFTLFPQVITDSNSTYILRIKSFNTAGGVFLHGPEKKERSYQFYWNKPFMVDGQSFVLIPNGFVEKSNGEYIVRWQPVYEAADELSQNLAIKPYDLKTTVIQLSLKTENLQRGKDVLNALYNEFNLSNIEDRNRLAVNTVKFIDDRLLRISGELKGVEGSLENYQGSKELVDIKSQSLQSLQNRDDVSKTIKDLAIQMGVVDMILDYFASPANSSKLVPSALGINDGTLALLITQYNELQLKRERESPSLAPNSTVMQDLNTQLTNLKSSILENLNNIKKNLQLKESNFQQQNQQYRTFLSSIPHNERRLQEIIRKQSITEGLYLYLLQKREESAISGTGSNISQYKQIDPATGYGPVEPNARNIVLASSFLALFLAFGWMYLRELLYDKIVTKHDIHRRLKVPVIGEISHVAKREQKSICVLDRSLVSEQFRSIRTNLYSVLRDANKKVILVTSSVNDEGKSFTCVNLAAVCAIPGKKVALLEFDVRRPMVATYLSLNTTTGLTDFLSGDINDLSEICQVSDEIPTLHIYPCGSVPLNAADLLLSERIKDLFDELKKEYDYIVVDSPPAGLVSDPFILARHSDVVAYIVRSNQTSKKQLDFLSEIAGNRSMKNISIILNDVRSRETSNYYNYETQKPGQIKKKSLNPVK